MPSCASCGPPLRFCGLVGQGDFVDGGSQVSLQDLTFFDGAGLEAAFQDVNGFAGITSAEADDAKVSAFGVRTWNQADNRR